MEKKEKVLLDRLQEITREKRRLKEEAAPFDPELLARVLSMVEDLLLSAANGGKDTLTLRTSNFEKFFRYPSVEDLHDILEKVQKWAQSNNLRTHMRVIEYEYRDHPPTHPVNQQLTISWEDAVKK